MEAFTAVTDHLLAPLIRAFEEATLWTWLAWSGRLLGISFIPQVLIQRRDRPMSALAWILCLIELPFLGLLAWWVFGLTHLRRKRRARADTHAIMQPNLAQLRGQLTTPLDAAAITTDDTQLGRAHLLLLNASHGIFPATRDNCVSLLLNGRDAYDAFERAIRDATHHIHLEFYIWRDDATGRRFRDLLVERAREGVQVRLLYDAIGGAEVDGRFMQPLLDAGGRAAPFSPVRLFERRLRVNFRNHRKILVVDGVTGFTGGVNIGDEYCDWEDTAVRLDGPVVYQLQEVFAEDWYFATGENLATGEYFPSIDGMELKRCKDASAQARVIASGPDLERPTMYHVFFMALTQSRQRIWLVTPYFIPEPSIITALTTAAMRGIDVQLIIPSRRASDVPIAQLAGRAFYEDLLGAGVQIFEYQDTILHAKILLIDQHWSFVGSANLDIRSFRLNFELNCLISHKATQAQLEEWFERVRASSAPIELQRFERRPRRHKVLEGVARLFSPLL
jgi:cardiolipin synthase